MPAGTAPSGLDRDRGSQRKINTARDRVSYLLAGGATIEAVRRQIADIPEYLKPVFDYWNDLRGDRLAPSWREFDLLALPPKVLPTTQVVDWLPEQEEFRFRFYGSGYREIHGVDLTGMSPRDLPFKGLGDFIHAEYLSVVGNGKPNMVSYGYRNGSVFVEIETCLRLPLSDDGHSVTGIVTVDVVAGGIPEARDAVENLVGHRSEFRSKTSGHD